MSAGAVFTRCADPRELARAGADAIVAAAAAAVAAHGEFRLALSGGATPQATYAELAARQMPWARTSVFFSDERCVPPDHAESNYTRARASLLARVPLDPTRVHRMPGELPPDAGAARYEEVLRKRCGGARTFDLCLLGVGADGHCASLFPGSPALDEQERWVVAAQAPPGVVPPWRLTLTLPCIAGSQQVLFLVSGADKAGVVAALRRGTGTAVAGRVRARGLVRWLVSSEAWGA